MPKDCCQDHTVAISGLDPVNTVEMSQNLPRGRHQALANSAQLDQVCQLGLMRRCGGGRGLPHHALTLLA